MDSTISSQMPRWDSPAFSLRSTTVLFVLFLVTTVSFGGDFQSRTRKQLLTISGRSRVNEDFEHVSKLVATNTPSSAFCSAPVQSPGSIVCSHFCTDELCALLQRRGAHVDAMELYSDVGSLAMSATHNITSRRPRVIFIEETFTNRTADSLLHLPELMPGRFYMINLHGVKHQRYCEHEESCESKLQSIVLRRDVIATNFDLGDHALRDNTVGYRIRGVTTLALRRHKASEWSKAGAYYSNRPRSRLVGFRGLCHTGWESSTTVRYDLAVAFNRTYYANVSILWTHVENDECPGIQPTSQSLLDSISYADILWGSHFCLLPRGDGRWLWRMGEALQTGCIPVIIADGVTLPFEQVIPWNEISIRIPESVVQRRDARAILSFLHTVSPARRHHMSTLGQRLFRHHMSTDALQARLTLSCAGIIAAD